MEIDLSSGKGAGKIVEDCLKKGFIINAIQGNILHALHRPLIIGEEKIDALVGVLTASWHQGDLDLKKDILSLLDLEKDDFTHLFDRALQLKTVCPGHCRPASSGKRHIN